jgi:hypothetical protein
MKTTALCLILVGIALLLPLTASAQQPMTVGAGFDLMLPVGSFGDNWGTGFGGTAELDYSLSIHTSVTGKLGYLIWSAKDLPSGVSATYGGVPVLVGVKYYPHLFVKQSGTNGIRAYGHLELGVMVGSVSISGASKGYAGSISGSTTDFTIVPSLGVEIPAGPKGAADVSVRYFDISRKSSIGFRVGYKMSL